MNKYIGDKAFYRKVLKVVVPIILQSLITNLVNLLDNVMVGQMGTESMSGVAIANQLIFIFNLAVFGALSGIGIFSAQFFGDEDDEGVRYTMRGKLCIVAVLAIVFIGLSLVKGEALISLFLSGGDDPAKVASTLSEGMRYLRIILLGLIPFGLAQVYGSTMKESGQTVVPMKAGIAAVLVNMTGNYILIFGHFGAPAMGVAGAALATVISRYVEALIIMTAVHSNKEKNGYVKGLYTSLHIPQALVKRMVITGAPLFVNEVLWSLGMSAITQSYSVRGLDAVAAQNICNTVYHLFSQAYFSIGSAISILVGQLLGADKFEEAKDTNRKLIAFSLTVSTVLGIIAFFLTPLFPRIYNTSQEVIDLATSLLRVVCLCMPISCLAHSCYYTLRSGGKTIITFLFDSVFIVCVAYPVSFVLSRFTDLPMLWLFAVVQLLDLIKAIIGIILVKKGIWINNIVH